MNGTRFDASGSPTSPRVKEPDPCRPFRLQVSSSGYCDGVSLRSFLKVGALGVGTFGLNQADIYRAEAATSGGLGHKAVINIFLGGGPHQDMWEIKTEASKIRGPFQPIPTMFPESRSVSVFQDRTNHG